MRTPDELDALDTELEIQTRVRDAVDLAIKATLDSMLEMLVRNMLERQALLELASIDSAHSAQSQLACVIHSEASCIALGLEPDELLVASSGLRTIVLEAMHEADVRWERTGWPASRRVRAAEVGAAAARAILPAILTSTP